MSGLLRRLTSTRIAAQLAAVVILAVVLIQLVVAASFHLLHEPPGQRDFVHVGTLVQLLAAEHRGDDRAHMVAEVARIFPELRPRLVADRPADLARLNDPNGNGPFGGLQRHVRGDLVIGVVGGSHPPPPPSWFASRPAAREIAVGMPDGEWLLLEEPPPPPPPPVGPFTASLIFGAVSVVLLGVWAARTLVRPLRSLAVAARDFDIESEPHPLVDAGPEEVLVASRAFDAMRERIRVLVEDRTGMLAAMGHDLRTPITRLRLRAEFVPDLALREEFLRDLALMNDMIEGALTYLREGRHHERPGLVDLAALLATICDQFEDMGHGVVYHGPDHLVRRLRAQALGRAFTNLVDNATKYGTATTVRLLPQADGGCRIEVEDDGPGIPPEDREAMLRPFARGDAARNLDNPTGFGLGLAIVRAVVEGHRGRLTLESGATGGLRVVVELPCGA